MEIELHRRLFKHNGYLYQVGDLQTTPGGACFRGSPLRYPIGTYASLDELILFKSQLKSPGDCVAVGKVGFYA